MNRCVMNKEIELVIKKKKKVPPKKSYLQGPDSFFGGFYQRFKEELARALQILPKNKRRGHTSPLFMRPLLP